MTTWFPLWYTKQKLYLYDKNQLNTNSDAYMRMDCWPASLEEINLLVFVCTLSIWFVLWQKPSLFENYLRFNGECTHMCYWKHYLHTPLCQITMSDLFMNVDTCVTDNTTYTMLYVRPIWPTFWWMYTHVLLLTLLTPCCMTYHYNIINDECITTPDLTKKVHTCATDSPTYTMVYDISL